LNALAQPRSEALSEQFQTSQCHAVIMFES
jgi:hypothetical protein